jgi:hypothetical protein
MRTEARFVISNAPIGCSFSKETPDSWKGFVSWRQGRARNNGHTVVVKEICNLTNNVSLEVNPVGILLHGTIM